MVALIIVLTGFGVATASAEEIAPKQVYVAANPLWTDTGITVTEGQTISVTYVSGTWNSGVTANNVGPEGDGANNLNDLFLAYPAASHGQLIAFVGSDPFQGHWGDGSFFPQQPGNGYWAIGSSATFTADRSGKLWLGMNGDAVSQSTGDNGGLLTTVTTVNGIPEFPSVTLPVAAILGLVMIFGRRKSTVREFSYKKVKAEMEWGIIYLYF